MAFDRPKTGLEAAISIAEFAREDVELKQRIPPHPTKHNRNFTLSGLSQRNASH